MCKHASDRSFEKLRGNCRKLEIKKEMKKKTVGNRVNILTIFRLQGGVLKRLMNSWVLILKKINLNPLTSASNRISNILAIGIEITSCNNRQHHYFLQSTTP